MFGKVMVLLYPHGERIVTKVVSANQSYLNFIDCNDAHNPTVLLGDKKRMGRALLNGLAVSIVCLLFRVYKILSERTEGSTCVLKRHALFSLIWLSAFPHATLRRDFFHYSTPAILRERYSTRYRRSLA